MKKLTLLELKQVNTVLPTSHEFIKKKKIDFIII